MLLRHIEKTRVVGWISRATLVFCIIPKGKFDNLFFLMYILLDF